MRNWVREHSGNVAWHFYGSGPYAHAACGNPSITGCPYTTDYDSLIDGHNKCGICEKLYETRNCCQ